ncbi:MAG: UTP--glucose-1-phosphate uridylyltransferase GalU [Chloroflexi bacterium]|nr:UTP--glucose-1-phosphate uridylyltransferase GalU [Chloroflexota bacterium]
MKIRKAVITAGGWGTRFLPLTKSQPKEMLPLVNKPLIQYSVEEAIACGVELIVIVTSLGKRAIEDHFDRSFDLEHALQQKGELKMVEEIRRLSNMVDICYVRQKEQLGLGHAVLMTRNVIGDEPFVLLLPDDLFEYREVPLKRMIEIYERYNASVIAVKEVAEHEVNRYGIISPQEVERRVYQVTGLVEKPPLGESPSNLAIMGRYVLSPEIFECLECTLPGRNQEIQLTDALQGLQRSEPVYAYQFEGERYDAGTLNGWLEATVSLALADPNIGPQFRECVHRQLSRCAREEKAISKNDPVQSLR